MPTYPLAYRVTDFLHRQRSWSENVLAEIAALEAHEDTAIETLRDQQAQREKEASALAKEYRGLFHEWERDKITTNVERKTIRALAQEVHLLTEKVRQRYNDAQQRVDSLSEENNNALSDLRRGRRSVTIYRPETLPSPDFIDRKA